MANSTTFSWRKPEAADLARLASPTPPAVSIYLPVGLAWNEREASRLRVRAALATVREKLAGVTVDGLETLEPALDGLAHPTRGIAVFCSLDGGAAFVLPEPPPAEVTVASQYALRPLVCAIGRNPRFRVLAVSDHDVRMFEGDAYAMRELAIEGLPRSLEDALGRDLQQRPNQMHSAPPAPGSLAPQGMVHGHGGAPDEQKHDRLRFHVAISQALDSALSGESCPTVLATTETHEGNLRKRLRIRGLLEESLPYPPGGFSAASLHAPALECVRRASEAERAALPTAWHRARGRGKGTANPEEIARAAASGTVRRLLVAERERAAGWIDSSSGRLGRPVWPDDEVLDGLCGLVLAYGGEVHPLAREHIPEQSLAAAVLR